MSEQGEIIIASIKQVKDICEQVGLLLQEADAMMDKAGWKTFSSTAKYGSAAVYNPRSWVPSRAVRFYTNKTKPDQQIVMSAVLYDDDDPGNLVEPLLITAALIAKNADGPAPEGSELDPPSWFFQHSSRSIDGEFEDLIPAEKAPDDKRDLRLVRILALPLVDIANSAVLKQRVIDKLVA
jgi:hypothetical protein